MKYMLTCGQTDLNMDIQTYKAYTQIYMQTHSIKYNSSPAHLDLYYQSLIKNDDNKSRRLFNVMRTLTDSKKEKCLPSNQSNQDLADSFSVYFNEKIKAIRTAFNPQNIQPPPTESLPETLNSFEPTNIDELRSIIKSHPIKCSQEDSIPANLVSKNIDVLLPIWVDLVNLSLSTGSMDCLKSAVLTRGGTGGSANPKGPKCFLESRGPKCFLQKKLR